MKFTGIIKAKSTAHCIAIGISPAIDGYAARRFLKRYDECAEFLGTAAEIRESVLFINCEGASELHPNSAKLLDELLAEQARITETAEKTAMNAQEAAMDAQESAAAKAEAVIGEMAKKLNLPII